MSRPTTSAAQRRSVRKQFRFTESEWRSMAAQALEARIYVSEFLRWKCLGVEPPRRRATPYRANLIRAQAGVGKMVSNIMQIRRVVEEMGEQGRAVGIPSIQFDGAMQTLRDFSDHLLDILTSGPLSKSEANAALNQSLVELDMQGKNLNTLARALNRQAKMQEGVRVRVPKDVIVTALTGVRTLSNHILHFLGNELTDDSHPR